MGVECAAVSNTNIQEEKYVLGNYSACSIVVAVLVVWVNASAFGMEERDHKEVSEYEKRFGLGPQPAVKKDEASDS